MGKFIIGTFVVLAVAFYVMSGGAEFEPQTRMAAAPDAQPGVAAPAAIESIVEQVVLEQAIPQTVEAPAQADVPAIEDVPTPAAAPVTVAETGSAPVFEGSQAGVNGIAPEFTSLSAPGVAAPAPDTPTAPGLSAIREVAARAVNMREGPDTSFPVLDTLPMGTRTEVMDRDGNGWVRVRLVDTGQIGWIAERLLTDG